VYPYPAVAQFKGSGDYKDAANWSSAAALYNVRTAAWAGAFIYTPYTPKLQGVAAP
jgi:hypothetical protein